ncbi:MAG: HAMP domain-containing sensor histidine kinase, partial [Saprospiraceae bacterium]|nr:HAMP domain-containing sensor histidine kinase [Saprospiraceae bacterium]
MTSAAIRRVVVLGAIAIIGILLIQAYWFRRNWSLAEKEFHQTVSIGLLNVAKSMADYNGSILPSSGLIKRVSSNYYVVNFNDVIDANLLEYYLLEEFGNLRFNTSFEYAIYDCSDDEMVYGNYCNVEDPERPILSDQTLPKYDEFIYYFGVKFPDHQSFLMGDMQISVILLIITLAAIVFFIYAIAIMLKQKRLSELQRDFINNMTHEFKTPISSIKLSTDVLLDNPAVAADQRLSRYAGIIREQNERLNQHVEQVLSIARIDDHTFHLQKEEVDLHDLINDIVENKELALQNGEVDLDVRLGASSDKIKADKLHLTNVIQNLLDNAVKYSNGHPMIHIETKDARDGL